MIVVLAGRPGVGKSAVRRLLAPMLGATSLGPDDFAERWPEVYERMRHLSAGHAPMVVECCALPAGLRWRLETRDSYIVHLTAPRETRYERMLRIRHPKVARQRADMPDLPLGYEDEVKVDLTLDTEGVEPVELANTIALAVTKP